MSGHPVEVHRTDVVVVGSGVAGLATAGRARWRFFQHLEALTASLHVESWERLMDFRMRGLGIGPYAVHKK